MSSLQEPMTCNCWSTKHAEREREIERSRERDREREYMLTFLTFKIGHLFKLIRLSSHAVFDRLLSLKSF